MDMLIVAKNIIGSCGNDLRLAVDLAHKAVFATPVKRGGRDEAYASLARALVPMLNRENLWTLFLEIFPEIKGKLRLEDVRDDLTLQKYKKQWDYPDIAWNYPLPYYFGRTFMAAFQVSHDEERLVEAFMCAISEKDLTWVIPESIGNALKEFLADRGQRFRKELLSRTAEQVRPIPGIEEIFDLGTGAIRVGDTPNARLVNARYWRERTFTYAILPKLLPSKGGGSETVFERYVREWFTVTEWLLSEEISDRLNHPCGLPVAILRIAGVSSEQINRAKESHYCGVMHFAALNEVLGYPYGEHLPIK